MINFLSTIVDIAHCVPLCFFSFDLLCQKNLWFVRWNNALISRLQGYGCYWTDLQAKIGMMKGVYWVCREKVFCCRGEREEFSRGKWFGSILEGFCV